MQISRTQMMLAEKLAAIAAHDVSDPAMPVAQLFDVIGRRVVNNRLGECRIYDPVHRQTYGKLIADRAIPAAAAPQVGLILSDPRRTEDQKMATILHLVASYAQAPATPD